VVTAALAALGAGLTHVVPEGLVWSQPAALVTLLWVGFVGASMCTHERRHLRLEVLARRLSPSRLRGIGAVSNGVTALFLLWLTLASVRYVGFHWSEWIETEYRGGLFQGTGVPRWLGFAALPWCFAVMGLRFAGQAVGVARGAALLRDEAGELARSTGAAPVAVGGEAP
jgi:TRAP-type C4-dicarboxylate transport system permease small subunit